MSFVTDDKDHKAYTYTSFGSSMVHHDGMLYVFGNVDVKENVGSYFHFYDIARGTWKKLGMEKSSDPENRYLHCSFVYNVSV